MRLAVFAAAVLMLGVPAAAQAPAPKPKTAQDYSKLFEENARKSAWVLDQFRGPVPEPAEDVEQKLVEMQEMILRASVRGGDTHTQQGIAKLLVDVSAVPPEEGLVADFANDLLLALTDVELDALAGRRLTQLLYVAFNSAALGRAEVRSLQEAVSSLLREAGADRNRIQTLLFNIQTVNDLIKAGAGVAR
jgi:hypothetical protein